jgi:polyphenol oxidase
MSDFCKVENEFIITHNGYSPQNAVYGFLGKETPIKSHKFLLHLDKNAPENRSGIRNVFGERYSHISILKQVHGNRVVEVQDVPDLGEEHEADAQVTNKKGILLAIQTADCVPLLFIDQENEVIGAAHAGWKGALAGIAAETLKKMQDLGAKSESVEVVIGPCIQQESYEVGAEFLEEFLLKDKDSQKFFIPGKKKEKYMFDLPGHVKGSLCGMGLKGIFDTELNTFLMKEKFFSHRRKKHEGSVMSVVGLT